ncbi:MAG: bifunctional DNA-formamidopyrimidine glycosylase/DNA-(apurinic or apyrimidinic site) lyase [Bdellovibrionaceae bacterium]|nr:bifunctional DNA-formamidopyrimidine glycosylase/DNA-(apurinic or apyrimidinic site) lyase [Bdellovibrio sp.]
MPELPEVEIVCRNLNTILKPPFNIKSWIFFRRDLRFKIPKRALQQIIAVPIFAIKRRAKFILFESETGFFISHLGMTGAWRSEAKDWIRRKHDHVAFEYAPGQFLIYEDPRRFGFIEFIKKSEIEKRFKDFGAEPLASHTDFEVLTALFKKLQAPIKTALMNQKFLVGVGNIYASEILFRAGVSPLKKCSKVTRAQFQKIWHWTQFILKDAIEKGGSTINNYRNSYGETGSYQSKFFVYDLAGETCKNCNSKIKQIMQSGRSTFWCPRCQK